MDTQKPSKEFWIAHALEKPHLDKLSAEGWDIIHLQFENGILHGVFSRDKVVAPVSDPPPTPPKTLISEAVQTVIIPTVVIPPVPVVIDTPDELPIPNPMNEGESVDETPLEDESPTRISTTQPPVIVVTASPPTDFEAELQRIKADDTLSPMEKVAALKKAGDTIAVEKARKAGELAWNAWNKLYPVTSTFRQLPEEVKS
ncbi:MAG: hypothetical protein SFZ02_06265 [bacterium]|nr:hypothetical protein [bacterium]